MDIKSQSRKIAKELKKNADVVHSTFDAVGLSILQFGFSVEFCGDEPEDVEYELLIEIQSNENSVLSSDISICVNFYDEDGDIIGNSSIFVFAKDFSGYDTVSTYIDDPELIRISKYMRIYAKKR